MRWEDDALGALAGLALGATAATAAPSPPFCFLAGLGGSLVLLEAHLLRRRPVAVALAGRCRRALASAFGGWP